MHRPEPTADPERRPLVLFDLSRLIARVARPAPTGIDRVELAYARFLLDSPDFDVAFVACAGERIRLVSPAIAVALVPWVEAIWAGLGEPRATADGLARVARFLGIAPPTPPPAAGGTAGVGRDGGAAAAAAASLDAPWAVRLAIDPVGRLLQNPVRVWARRPLEPFVAAARDAGRRLVYVHVSHHNLQKPEPFRALKAAGLPAAVMVHDLIPIEYPEFARPGDDAKHARRMATVAETADLVVTNSADTARRFARHIAGLGRPVPETLVAHLGIPPAAPPRAAFDPAAPPYFALVSTIEARKNHYLMLNLWREIAERRGPQTPKLVVVGRRGWEIENVVDLMERSPAARAHVLEAGALTDEALAVVLAGARALLMPSLVEGYGLPIVEALAAGVPVLASDIPVHAEVAQGLADLLAPLDGPAWAAAIEDYAAAGSPRRAARAARLAEFRPPTWDAHFAAVAPALAGLAR